MTKMKLILVIFVGLLTGYGCLATHKDGVDNHFITLFGNDFVAYGLEDFKEKATNGQSLKTFFEQLNVYIKMAQVNNQRLRHESYELVHKSFNMILQFIQNPNRISEPFAFKMRLNLLQLQINKFTENANFCSLILKFPIEWVEKRLYLVTNDYDRTHLRIIANLLKNANKSINEFSIIIQAHINDIKELAGPFNQPKINEENFPQIIAIIDNLTMIINSHSFVTHMETSVKELIDLISAHTVKDYYSEDEMDSLDEENQSVYLTPNESDFEKIVENIRMGIQHLSI